MEELETGGGNRTATLNGDDAEVRSNYDCHLTYHLPYPLTLDHVCFPSFLSRVFHLLLSTSNFFFTSMTHHYTASSYSYRQRYIR